MHFDVVLTVFIHPCSKKRRRAQYSCRVDATVCVRVLQMCVRARASVRGKLLKQRATVPPTIPSVFLCSPCCAFGQSLYQVLIHEIERECTRWR